MVQEDSSSIAANMPMRSLAQVWSLSAKRQIDLDNSMSALAC
jgi:hypothetical protein